MPDMPKFRAAIRAAIQENEEANAGKAWFKTITLPGIGSVVLEKPIPLIGRVEVLIRDTNFCRIERSTYCLT